MIEVGSVRSSPSRLSRWRWPCVARLNTAQERAACSRRKNSSSSSSSAACCSGDLQFT